MPAAAASDAAPQNGSAITYSVPQKRIVSIEHPCIVKNFSNAFKSLGGEQQLKHVIEHKIGDGKRSGSEPTALVSLRPDDPLAKKLASTVAPTQNILVKVTIPKRTGRKRKRGSDEPFTEDTASKQTPESITAPELLERLRENSGTYTLQAVGAIQDTHRFETLPDLQMRADELPIMREIRDRAMQPDYERLREFYIDNKPGWDGITAFPGPPLFITAKRPYSTPGQPDESVRLKKKPKKKQKFDSDGRHIGEPGFALETENVPQGPPATLKPPGPSLTHTIAAMKSLMEKRPILTHRAADGLLPDHTARIINAAAPYVGYYVHKGPWEGTIIKHGLDPRRDPNYRFYQTLQFNFSGARELNKALNSAASPNAAETTTAVARHVFDGKILCEAAKYWQLCDLTDPVLRSLVHVSDIRRDCDVQRFGWYHNGTMGKIRTIMRDKMVAMVNRERLLGETEYAVLASLPERVEDEAVCVVGEGWGPAVGRMAGHIGKEAMRGPFRTDRMLRRPTAGVRGEMKVGDLGVWSGQDVVGVEHGVGQVGGTNDLDGHGEDGSDVEEHNDGGANDEDESDDQSASNAAVNDAGLLEEAENQEDLHI